MQYAVDGVSIPRPRIRRWVLSTLSVLRRATDLDPRTVRLTIRFVDLDEGRALNRGFRAKSYATNVLTFPLDDASAPDVVEADIVVCLPVVAREAAEQHKPLVEHCAHLVVHGTLHACGFDHEVDEDADAMETLERAVLARLRIADPYRVR